MGLKPHRSRDMNYDAHWFMDEVAERGGIACISTVGSGAAMDQARQLATYPANGSGAKPLGMLVWDMVDVDLTRYKLNQHKSEVQKGGKVPIVRVGEFETNMIEGTVSAAGPAYVGHSGKLTPTYVNDAATPRVGDFRSTPDEDGYATVWINII
jgi:hypothetical protein